MKIKQFFCLVASCAFLFGCSLASEEENSKSKDKESNSVQVEQKTVQNDFKFYAQEDTPVEFSLKSSLYSSAKLEAISKFKSGAVANCSDLNCSVSYPPNYSGNDEATYRLVSKDGDIFQGKIHVEVFPVNDAPSFTNKLGITQTRAGEVITIQIPEAYDPDGDKLEYYLVSAPLYGKLLDCSEKLTSLTCKYLPPLSGEVEDQLTFMATDGELNAEMDIKLSISEALDEDGDFLPDVIEGQNRGKQGIADIPSIQLKISSGKSYLSIANKKEELTLLGAKPRKHQVRNSLLVMAQNAISQNEVINKFEDNLHLEKASFINWDNFQVLRNFINGIENKLQKGMRFDSSGAGFSFDFTFDLVDVFYGKNVSDISVGLYYLKGQKSFPIGSSKVLLNNSMFKMDIENGSCLNCKRTFTVNFDGINPIHVFDIIKNEYPLYLKVENFETSSDFKTVALTTIKKSVKRKTFRLLISLPNKLIDKELVLNAWETLEEVIEREFGQIHFSDTENKVLAVSDFDNEVFTTIDPRFVEPYKLDLNSWHFFTDSDAKSFSEPLEKGKTYAFLYAKVKDIVAVLPKYKLQKEVSFEASNYNQTEDISSIRPNDEIEIVVQGFQEIPKEDITPVTFNTWHFNTRYVCSVCQSYSWYGYPSTSGGGTCKSNQTIVGVSRCRNAVMGRPNFSHGSCGIVCTQKDTAFDKKNRSCTAKYRKYLSTKSDVVGSDLLKNYEFEIYAGGTKVSKVKEKIVLKSSSGNQLNFRFKLDEVISSQGYDSLTINVLPTSNVKSSKIGLISHDCTDEYQDISNTSSSYQSIGIKHNYKFLVKINGVER